MKPKHEESARWLSQAQRDLDAAAVLFSGRHFNLTCFHSQQAAEKAVKAFLYSCGAEDVWGHSVSELVADASTFDATLGPLQTTGALLDKYYIATRYPNGLPGGIPADAYDATEASRAMEWARAILGAIGEKLNHPLTS